MSKPAVWMGRSKEAVSGFPDEARRQAVYVLHAFEKKSQKTPQKDLTIAQENYKEMLHYRKGSRP